MLDGRGAIPISIHSLRVEGDRVPPCSLISVIIFQSTPSVWRETGPSKSIDLPEAISIHSLRVEGDHGAAMRAVILHAISIHSLRVEGDTDLLAMLKVDLDFNPLPPCGGRLCSSRSSRCKSSNFNPLPPCGGRRDQSARANRRRHFNPLPPCGGRPDPLRRGAADGNFNPLPPCGGRPSG